MTYESFAGLPVGNSRRGQRQNAPIRSPAQAFAVQRESQPAESPNIIFGQPLNRALGPTREGTGFRDTIGPKRWTQHTFDLPNYFDQAYAIPTSVVSCYASPQQCADRETPG